MLWTTKLTNAGLSEDRFGKAFQANVKKYNKYSETLKTLKAQAKKPGADTDEIAERIQIVEAEIEDLNKKLSATIQRYINNPDLIEQHRARLKGFNEKRKQASSSSAPANDPAPPAQTAEPKPADNPAPEPTPAPPTQTAEPVKPKPADPKPNNAPKPADKKKSSAGAIIGWSIVGFVIGAVTGIAIKNRA